MVLLACCLTGIAGTQQHSLSLDRQWGWYSEGRGQGLDWYGWNFGVVEGLLVSVSSVLKCRVLEPVNLKGTVDELIFKLVF